MPRMNQINQDVDGPAGTLLTTTTETVIATLPGISTYGPDNRVILEGMAAIAAGTGVTALQLRVRRGTTIAGTQVGATAVNQYAASVSNTPLIQVDDFPGEVSGQQYCLTVQQVGATGNGTCNAANLQATY